MVEAGINFRTGRLDIVKSELRLVDGDEETAQNIRILLDSNFGEWEFGPGEGLRWQQVLGRHGEDLSAAGAELKRCILSAAPEGALTRFELEQDGEELLLEFEVALSVGEGIKAEGFVDVDGELDLMVWVV